MSFARRRAASNAPLILLAVATLAAHGAAVARSLDEPPAYGERLEVQLVNLEVFATDRSGAPVADLTAADFRVTEDGRPVDLSHFSRVAGGGTGDAPGRAAGAADAGPAHLAVFLDEVHVGAASRRRVLDQVAGALAGELGAEDRVLLAIYDGSTRVALPFTTDRGALRRALRDAGALSPARLVVERDRDSTFEDVQYDMSTRGCMFVGEYARTYAEREHERVRRALLAFSQFVDSLAGIPGRKVVVHVSDGIPLRAGGEITDLVLEMCNGEGVRQGLPGATHVVLDDAEVDKFNPTHAVLDAERYNTAPLWDALAARANAGRVSIYTLAAGRPAGTGGIDLAQAVIASTAATQARHSRNLQDTLFVLADSTGGRAFLDRNDHQASLRLVARDLHSYYFLGYAPPRPEAAGVRRIQVEVARPGVELRYRKSYQPRGADQQVVEKLFGQLLHGIGDNPARARLGLAGKLTGPGGGRARVEVKIPLRSLAMVDAGAARQGLFRVFLVAADERGATTSVRNAAVPVVVRKDGPAPADYTYQVEIQLDGGRHQLAVAVRDELTGETSFVRHILDM